MYFPQKGRPQVCPRVGARQAARDCRAHCHVDGRQPLSRRSHAAFCCMREAAAVLTDAFSSLSRFVAGQTGRRQLSAPSPHGRLSLPPQPAQSPGAARRKLDAVPWHLSPNFSCFQVRISHLFLDTTYCDPKHTFPSQAESVEFIAQTIHAEMQRSEGGPECWIRFIVLIATLTNAVRLPGKTLFLIATYAIGKEKILFRVAGLCGCKLVFTLRTNSLLHLMNANPIIPLGYSTSASASSRCCSCANWVWIWTLF